MTMHATDFLPAISLLPPARSAAPQRHFPVLFLSDLHLGSRACRDEALLSFLQGHTADAIYLVGDIIDTWLPFGAHWTAAQHQVLAILLDRARLGTRLIYTPGNHDAFFRRFAGQDMLGIEVVDRIVHEAADGRRYLVVHGDESDVFDRYFPRLSRLGTRIDSVVRGLIGLINRQRARLGWAEWALVDRLVKGFNDAVRACDPFEERLADLARAHGTDGIICGHFHKPALHSDHGVAYANCGDWVENATALVETASGRLLLIDWATHGTETLAEHAGLDMTPADAHMGFAKTAKSI
jgi:UDP-2,3-diacylglucosamine pyrophosphatase LpxH